MVFSGTHCYLADGSILRWLTNLERLRALLPDETLLYPGHGPIGGHTLIDEQRDYLLAYCTAMAELAGGAAPFDAHAMEQLVARLTVYRPEAALSFMISLSAPAVSAELAPPAR